MTATEQPTRLEELSPAAQARFEARCRHNFAALVSRHAAQLPERDLPALQLLAEVMCGSSRMLAAAAQLRRPSAGIRALIPARAAGLIADFLELRRSVDRPALHAARHDLSPATDADLQQIRPAQDSTSATDSQHHWELLQRIASRLQRRRHDPLVTNLLRSLKLPLRLLGYGAIVPFAEESLRALQAPADLEEMVRSIADRELHQIPPG